MKRRLAEPHTLSNGQGISSLKCKPQPDFNEQTQPRIQVDSGRMIMIRDSKIVQQSARESEKIARETCLDKKS